jgi:hypothetical protein
MNFFRAFSIALILVAPAEALAQVTKLRNPVARIMEPQNLIDLIVTIVQFLGGPVVVIGVIYAGYLFVSAQGETGQLEKARHALLWTIVGAAVILGASVLKSVVQGTIIGLQ